MNVKEISIADLKPYKNNPRKNDSAVEAVTKSIEQFGFKVPLVIDSKNVIVAGHTRYKAAKLLKLEKVPCIVADDLTPEQIKAFRLADNKTAEFAEWDFEKLGFELVELKKFDFDMAEFNFDLSNIDGVYVSPDDFGENFSLPTETNDKREFFQMCFILQREQKKLIDSALEAVKEDITETFGNSNKNGNALYEVVKQWAEQKKLL